MLSIQILRKCGKICGKCGEFSKLTIQNFYLKLPQETNFRVVLRQRHNEGGSLRANARRSGTLRGGALTQSKLNDKSNSKFFWGVRAVKVTESYTREACKNFSTDSSNHDLAKNF